MMDLLSPFSNFRALQWFQGAALLEYPSDYLDFLQDKTVDHHFGNWDEIFRRVGKMKPAYDLWLDKYDAVLQGSKDIPVIDLGCGYGNDTLYLHERGYRVISCDLSLEALKRLDYFIDKPVIRHFDMLAGLPFDDGSARVVIADLSIHYFRWTETERIVEEIGRVLTGDGHLLCRVNSTGKIKFGPDDGIQMEEHYFALGERKKRYFSKDDLEKLFSAWDICRIDEYCLERFGSSKVLWEIAVRKSIMV